MGKLFTAYIFCAFVFVFFSCSFASAFGVSTIYSDNFPLRIQPGQVKETFFLLSNVVEGDSDVIIDSQLIAGTEIANLINENNRYTLTYGAEVEVPIRIEIPQEAVAGTKYRVGMMFLPVPLEAQEANIQFLVNIGKSFPVVVIGEGAEADDIERGVFTLTLEEQPEQIVREFSPGKERNTGFLVGIIIVLAFGILVTIVLIIYLVVRGRRREQDISMAFAQQPQRDFYGVNVGYGGGQ